MTRLSLPLSFALVLWASAPCAAQINLGPSDDVESALNALSPGDEVILADGMYTLSGRFSFTAVGEAGNEIVIRAADGATPHFRRPDASQNIWDIDVQHVIIRGLTFSGGSAGIRVEAASYLTIEDCEIFDTADVALRMNDTSEGQTYESVRILRNDIHDTGGTGEGMYLGCNNDGCRLANALIAGNYVHGTNGASVSQGDGIELKLGSYGCVIRDNVIHDTGYPCILGYGANGNGAPNLVEGNVMWGCGEHAIQWAADATIQNNIILGAVGNGIASQMHQGATPSNLRIVHNTVLAPNNDALSVRGATGAVLVANNALYAMSGRAFFVNGDSSMITSLGNVGVGAQQGISGGFTAGDIGADFVSASFSGGLPNDVFPTSGGGLAGAGDVGEVIAADFNGTDRMGVADVGAYALGDGSNPGWMLATDFKPAGATPPPRTDAGVPMSDGGIVPPGSDGGPPPVGSDAGGGVPADGGVIDPGGDGCGCGVVGRSRAPTAWWLIAALLGASVLRRRRPYGAAYAPSVAGSP